MTDWPIVGLTAALVLITGYYAWQNKRTADQNTHMVEELLLQRAEMRRQTQLGFYRPRLAVLRGVRRALGYAARDGKVPGETITELLRATREKEFLFRKDLCDYLDDLYRKCVHNYTLHLQLEDLERGSQRTRLVNEAHDLLTWILDQPVVLGEKFRPCLQVEGPGQELTA